MNITDAMVMIIERGLHVHIEGHEVFFYYDNDKNCRVYVVMESIGTENHFKTAKKAVQFFGKLETDEGKSVVTYGAKVAKAAKSHKFSKGMDSK